MMTLRTLAPYFVAIVLFTTLPLVVNMYYLHLLIITGFFIIYALSYDLLLGHTGLLSLAAAAFFGTGGYTAALVSTVLGVSFPASIACAMIVPACIAAAMGFVAFRTKGHYFVLMTLALSESIYMIVINLEFTHGPRGISNIPVPSIDLPGFGPLVFSSKLSIYLLTYLFVAVCALVMFVLEDSRVGRILHSIRDDEELAESLGVNILRFKMLAFVISASFAGLAGALYAHYMTVVTPDILVFAMTVTAIVAVAVGGAGTKSGPFLGAFLTVLIPEILRVAETYRLLFSGAILIIIALFIPEGFFPRLYKLIGHGSEARVEESAAEGGN
jgi:branched-chain amino acid transport system permease protein